jgi:hypothetical protein
MSVINRRNAVLGWLTWMVGKRVVKRKVAEASTPGRKKAAALAAGGAVGALTFWKTRASGDSSDRSSSPG